MDKFDTYAQYNLPDSSVLSRHSPCAYAVALTSTDTSDDKNCVTRTVHGKTQNGETYFRLWCATF